MEENVRRKTKCQARNLHGLKKRVNFVEFSFQNNICVFDVVVYTFVIFVYFINSCYICIIYKYKTILVLQCT